MKSLKITIILLIVSQVINAQITFNRIIEDTLNHITSSVITVDTGYVLLTGSRNEFMVRTFAVTYIDINGNRQWKKTYTDSENEMWEGYNNLSENTFPYTAGTNINTSAETNSIFLQKFDTNFDQNFQVKLFDNTILKRAFDQLFFMNNFYIVGQIYDEIADDIRLMLIKTDNSGNAQWLKTFGQNYEAGDHIISNYENNLIIGGLTSGFSAPLTNYKWYIIKTDTLGNLIWEKAYGHSSRSNGSVKDLIETSDSNIIACGSYPVANYGSGSGEYLWDGCLRKIDQNGDLVWKKMFRNYSCYPDGTGITLKFSIKSLGQLQNSDLIIIGSSYWYYSIHRGFMLKTDSQGNIKWHRYYYAVSDDSRWQYFSSFKSTSDKGIIIAGYGNDYSNIGYDPPQQAWLVKTDSLGMDGLCNIEPDELNIDIDIPQIPEGICMNDTIEVYVYIAGKSAPYTIEFSTGQVIDSVYYPSCFVPVEIGLTDINLEWGGETYFEETITEATLSNHEWGQCIAKPIEFYTPTTWGPQDLHITITDAYGETKTITKEIFAVECSTYNNLPISSNVKIYPNPVIDKLNIEIPKDYNFNYAKIYSSNGQLVFTHDLINGANTIDLVSLLSGTYVIKLSDTNGNTESKVFEKIE